MKLLRKIFLRSPEAVYRAYAWLAGVRYASNAIVSVLVISLPACVLIWWISGNAIFAIALGPLLTALVEKILIPASRGNRKMKYVDARLDPELSAIVARLCKKAGIAPMPVMSLWEVRGEVAIEQLAKDVCAIFVPSDIRNRYDLRELSGIFAHELGHLLVPFQHFIRSEVDAHYLWLSEAAYFAIVDFAKHCVQRDKGGWAQICCRFFWYFSCARSRQLNEYAADAYAVCFLQDALPLAMALHRIQELDADSAKEEVMIFASHPANFCRIRRLLDINFAARHAR